MFPALLIISIFSIPYATTPFVYLLTLSKLLLRVLLLNCYIIGIISDISAFGLIAFLNILTKIGFDFSEKSKHSSILPLKSVIGLFSH